jgi:hypothetical protein
VGVILGSCTSRTTSRTIGCSGIGESTAPQHYRRSWPPYSCARVVRGVAPQRGMRLGKGARPRSRSEGVSGPESTTAVRKRPRTRPAPSIWAYQQRMVQRTNRRTIRLYARNRLLDGVGHTRRPPTLKKRRCRVVWSRRTSPVSSAWTATGPNSSAPAPSIVVTIPSAPGRPMPESMTRRCRLVSRHHVTRSDGGHSRPRTPRLLSLLAARDVAVSPEAATSHRPPVAALASGSGGRERRAGLRRRSQRRKRGPGARRAPRMAPVP